MHSFETKKGKTVNLPSGKSDIILDIDVLPNRAHDCFCHLGIAKEISALFNLPLKAPEKLRRPDLASGVGVPTEASGKPAAEFLKLKVEEPALCRRYIAAIILDIKVGPSPVWMQERLLAVGQKPINNVVDAANYVMFEMGQPLHAFDMDKVESGKIRNPKSGIRNKFKIQNSKFKTIIIRRAKKGERITTLDNKTYELDENMLVIADEKEPLAIAGIKGGKKAEIEKKTKNIILESANFEPVNIRFTSKKIGLATGASVGFENEISMVLAELAMTKVMALIQEIAGGKIGANWLDFYPKKFKPPQIIFRQSDVSKLLGIAISEKEITSTLEKLRFEVKKTKGTFTVIGPSERLDLNIKEDVIEEIARIHDYEKIPPKIPEGILIPAPRNENYFYENIIRELLVGLGFSEVYNYSFSGTGEIEIENSIAKDKKFLRLNLLDGLKDNVQRNFKYFDEVRIFEIGKVFEKDGKNIMEKSILAGILAYKKPKTKNEEFYEIKGVLEMLLARLGINDYWFAEHPMKLAEIKISDEGIGFVDKNAFELDLRKLIKIATEEIEYRPVSKYPAATRDIAILVPLKTKMSEALDVIENTAGSLLIDTDLFDVYEGKELGEGKKNLAFHLIFQSSEKTLSDKEVNVLMDKIIKALEENPEWEVRKK